MVSLVIYNLNDKIISRLTDQEHSQKPLHLLQTLLRSFPSKVATVQCASPKKLLSNFEWRCLWRCLSWLKFAPFVWRVTDNCQFWMKIMFHRRLSRVGSYFAMNWISINFPRGIRSLSCVSSQMRSTHSTLHFICSSLWFSKRNNLPVTKQNYSTKMNCPSFALSCTRFFRSHARQHS